MDPPEFHGKRVPLILETQAVPRAERREWRTSMDRMRRVESLVAVCRGRSGPRVEEAAGRPDSIRVQQMGRLAGRVCVVLQSLEQMVRTLGARETWETVLPECFTGNMPSSRS